MPFNLKAILSNSSTRILVIIFFSLVAITAFFLIQGYHSQINLFQEAELNKLSGVARTIALQIDGDNHQQLYNDYQEMDGISSTTQDGRYLVLHELLKTTHDANQLNTAIYTMVYNATDGVFHFVGTSDEQPYFRHTWEKFKPDHVNNYQVGGNIPPYEDEHGTWLSAFAPIKDSRGKVVGIVQVDETFDRFRAKAWDAIMENGLISLGVFFFVALFMLRSIRSILLKEDSLNAEILKGKLELEVKNKDIMDSIYYAKRIQEAILLSVERIRASFPESFVLFMPKDIVSGDFYWFAERNDKLLIAAVDCTGHGVPGAFMSMIGNTILNDIVNSQGIVEPAEILNRLHQGIAAALKQDDPNIPNRDGMDMALCAFNKNSCVVEYAGAFRPLVLVRNGELTETKADKFPIGGGNFDNQPFTNHQFQCEPGDTFYLYSDGYADQFGGVKGKKYMTKRFKALLTEHYSKPLQQQHDIYAQAFNEWCGTCEQVDDVLVMGLKFPLN